MATKKDQMPMSTRMERWYANYSPERIKEQMEKFRPMYAKHAETQFADLEQMEVRVKHVLNVAGIPVIHVVPYLCFAREVWKLQKRYHFTTLSREVAVKVGKWVARTLSEDLLWLIAGQVFDIGRPEPEA